LKLRDGALDLSGADFVVLHANDESGQKWIVRSPRRADVFARAETERVALSLVRPKLSVRVPDPRVFSPELIAYPRMDGEPAAIVDLEAGGYVWRFDEKDPPRAFIESLATALAQLHAIDRDQRLREKSSAEIRATYRAQMDRARGALKIPEAICSRWQAWLEDERSWPSHSVLVHGDLHPAHVLLDGAHRVIGVLDWTEAHFGDPATDFALFFATLGERTLDALLEHYERAGGQRWPAMAKHVASMWSAYPVVIAQFAIDTAQEGPLSLAQTLIDAQA
jgi:macrolide phosphotransferase